MEEGGNSRAMAPSGSYVLIVVSQPLTEEHKEVILDRLNKGLLSWDIEATGCDLNGLEAVCSNITSEQLHENDVLLQHSTERLGVEVLVSPTVSTLKQCIKNLFSTSTAHKQLVHAGYTFAGSGAWIMQNGAFSFEEFLDVFQHADVVRVQKGCHVNVHCAPVGKWTSETLNKLENVSFNPPPKVDCVPGTNHIVNCLRNVLSSQALEEIMEASPLVGNIRFNRPTLYMFPAGQGDCALFGINGFNMLIDGGFSRKPCSWEFIRHLDRLDAVLVTRLSENNICGMSTLMKRKALNNTYPQIGYVFCNIADGKSRIDPAGDQDELIVSVAGEGHTFVQTLNDLQLKPHQCWRDSSVEPFVLYHKVGHGTLEMHVLSPPKDSKEMKDFLSEWNSYKETFSFVKTGSKSKSIPLSNATSICAILVWRPADPKDTITRILFPGSAPQGKIFESLEKLKNLDILHQPIVTKASLSSKLITKVKSNKLETKASIPNRKNTASPALSSSSVASKNGDIGLLKKEVKKIVKKEVINKGIKREIKKETKKDLSKEVKTDIALKDVKKDKDVKDNLMKKEVKEVKKMVKKDIKSLPEKRTEVKPLEKKVMPSSTVPKAAFEIKKTTIKKAPLKKESEPNKLSSSVKPIAEKSDIKKPIAKTTKDITNKKVLETKVASKIKPRVSASPTTKLVSKVEKNSKANTGLKSSTKITEAVAASSAVVAAVAVTVAAIELNEKKDVIEDTEKAAEYTNEEVAKIDDGKEKESEVGIELGVDATLEGKNIEDYLPEEMVISPLPPEAVSPTPSDSASLTPSDTLSSAPLETVSPTPPLQNEQISIEEKEVNEIKSIEQDLVPDEKEMLTDDDDIKDLLKAGGTINDDLESKPEIGGDLMTTSFIKEKDLGNIISETEVTNSALTEESRFSQNTQEMGYDYEAHEPVVVRSTENMHVYSENQYEGEIETSVDDPLAGATMEGSFCSGMMPTRDEQDEQFSDFNIHKSEIQVPVTAEQLFHAATNKEAKDFEDDDMDSDSVVRQGFAIREEHAVALQADNNELLETLKSETTTELLSGISTAEEELVSEEVNMIKESDESSVDRIHENFEAIDSNIKSSNEYSLQDESQNDEKYCKEIKQELLYGEKEFDTAVITESEIFEETPKEIVRKESSVSITYNDEIPGDYGYDDQYYRRKSGTESEDDVDLQKYLSKEPNASLDPDKLSAGHVRNDSDSDDEDVVKSPTPHAIVDYEGQEGENVDQYEIGLKENTDDPTVCIAKKGNDYDEKDRDSAEDEEEMIRHPTPPEERQYIDDLMRGPMISHFPHQIPGISEQPLYEEPEDSGSERSQSPIVEQPVFGSVIQADFPELVTVSGGTTPSEPQSPKSGFELKKFNSDAALGVMDALSEHDCSESSSHSPLCHEGATAFDISDKCSKEQYGEVTHDLPHDFSSENVVKGTCDDNVHCGNDFQENLDSLVLQDFPIRQQETSVSQSYDSHQVVDSKVLNIQYDETSNQQEMNYNYPSNEDYNRINDEVLNASKDEIMCEQISIPQGFQNDPCDPNQFDIKSQSYEDQFGIQVDSKSDCQDDNRSDIHDSRSDIHEDVTAEIQDNKSDIHDSRSDIHEDVIAEIHADGDVCSQEAPDAHFDTFGDNGNVNSNPMGNEDFKYTLGDNQVTDFSVKQNLPGNYQYETEANLTSSGCYEIDDGIRTDEIVRDQEVMRSPHFMEESEKEKPDYYFRNESSDLLSTQSNMQGNNNFIIGENITGISQNTENSSTYSPELGLQSQIEENAYYRDSAYSENNFSASRVSEIHDHTEQNQQGGSSYEDPDGFSSKLDATHDQLSALSTNIEMAPSMGIPHSGEFGDEKELVHQTFQSGGDIFCPKSEFEQFSKNNTIDGNLNSNDERNAVNSEELYAEEGRFDVESNSQYLPTSTPETIGTNGFDRQTDHSELSDNLGHQTFPVDNRSAQVNGKKQSWTESAEFGEDAYGSNTAYSEQYSTNNLEKSEQEASYIIDSRFHSDSPEDNIMRNDSSPDAPIDPAAKFAELKSVLSADQHSVGYNEDFANNMNFPGSGVLPAAPNNKLRNINPENPYGESSEDEDSSSLPGTVSPYAYTNKAYAQEEEDVDGNHIYKNPPPSDVIKNLEFDGNNPQTVETHRMAYPSGIADTLSTADNTNYDFHLEEWGKPMGLPTPPDAAQKTAVKKTVVKSSLNNGKAPSASKLLTSSPLKKVKPKTTKEAGGSSDPVYVDLAYVPHHGDPQYCDVEFFNKIRARYYVFSGVNPSKEVLNALLEAKKSWNEDLEVTIIPTYETDTLGYWVAQNQDDLAQYSIEIAPSASRCTVNLQDHETSCAAYRLEF